MGSSSRSYQDILAPRKDELSNFMWVSRQLSPQIAYQQNEKPTPQFHKDEVLKSSKIQELLEAVSRHESIEKGKLEAQVRAILDEIGYNRKLKLIRWLALVLVKICNRICKGIHVNLDAVVRLKSQLGNCPVIFVPSHRSYADFILTSYLCFSEDISIPAIVAGMDFYGMKGMGTVLRDTGAFFMRRTYNDDSLYWTTFKQYVHQLVTKGELPLEFFIEGTRSRTNKSLMPKFGLMLMILKAFILSQVPDILFVPINITYDRILEEKLFAFELLGIPKPKESTSGFFKSLSIIKEKYGNIYLGVAEPISVKRFFGSSLDRSVHSLQPIHQQEITEDEKKIIPSLAFEILHKQQKNCVITTFNLIAIILHNNLFNETDLLSIEELISEISWLKKIVEFLGGFVESGDLKSNVFDALQVHKNLVEVKQDGKVTLIWNKIILDKDTAVKFKAHTLSEKTLSLCVPFVMLQLYINPVLHYFVDVSLLVVIFKHHSEDLSKDELFERYHFLRNLLVHEFVTYENREKEEFEAAISHCLKLNFLNETNEMFMTGREKKCRDVVYNCIEGFIFTYYVVCIILLETSKTTLDEKSILTRVQAEIEARLNRENSFINPYSLSLDTITNSLNSLASQKALIKSRSKSTIVYEIQPAEVLTIKNKLEQYIAPMQVLQRKLESVHLHLKNKL